MRSKRPNIPKSVEIQDKYKQHYVLPKIQDEEAQLRLSRAIAISFMLLFPLLSWIFLHYGLDLFHRGWIAFVIGLIILLLVAFGGFWFGNKIVKRATAMRIENYKILYSQYEKELHEVSDAREILIKAEGRLAHTEQRLDKLIASTHNRPLIVASLAAVSAVFADFLRGKKVLNSISRDQEEVQQPDFTDKIVEEHDRKQQVKEDSL